MPITKRTTPQSSSQLLRQIIEDAALTEAIQALAPDHLARLIDHVGLEDAGEILLFATSDQLLGVFDTDLWLRDQGGDEETFDAKRFLLWLEVLLESGEKALVSRLVELPEDLLFWAFHSHLLVLNMDDLISEEVYRSRRDLDLIDKALESCVGQELDEYFVVARQPDGWDTLVGTILAFDEHEPDFLRRLLSRCCYASAEYIEENGGLYEVLTAEEMLAADAAADRADRRAKQGFVAPSDAAAFLRLAARTAPDDILDLEASDSVTRAYFRELDRTETRQTGGGAPLSTETAEDGGGTASRLLPLLAHAGVLSQPLPMLPESENVSGWRGRFQATLTALSASAPDGHEHRVQLLIYLANVIEAGLGSVHRPIRPADAMKAVFAVCDVGLDRLDGMSDRNGEESPTETSRAAAASPVTLFRLGWRVLSEHAVIGDIGALNRAIAEWEQSQRARRRP